MVAAEEVSKKKLRKESLFLRSQVRNKEVLERKIKEKILKNEKVLNSSSILIYVSKKEEVDTFKMIEEFWKLKKQVFVPKVEKHDIVFYKIESFKDLTMGRFHILEPNSKERYQDNSHSCAIIPGLLFDKDNNRLGYGGGYYDRFLSKHNIYKIGICFSSFLVDEIITNTNDIKMDEVITER